MRFNIFIATIFAFILSGCAGVITPSLSSQVKISKVAVVSFFKDEVRGLRDRGVSGDTFGETSVNWKVNDFVKNTITESLAKQKIEVLEFQYSNKI